MEIKEMENQLKYKMSEVFQFLEAEELVEQLVNLMQEYDSEQAYDSEETPESLINVIDCAEKLFSVVRETRLKRNLTNAVELDLAALFEKYLKGKIINNCGFHSDLFQKYFEHCINWQIQGAIDTMLEKFGTHHELWILAAKLILKVPMEKTTHMARDFLVRGSMRCPTSIELLAARIDLDIDLIKNARTYEKAMTLIGGLYEKAKSLSPDVEFYHKLNCRLQVLPPSKLKVLVLRDTIEHFPNTAAGLDASARLQVEVLLAYGNPNAKELAAELSNAYLAYQSALRDHPSMEKEISEYYISFVDFMRKNNLHMDPRWDNYFERPGIKVDAFLLYASLDGPVNVAAMKKAYDQFPNQGKFLLRILEYYLKREDIDNAKKTFMAINSSKVIDDDDIVESWKMFAQLQYNFEFGYFIKLFRKIGRYNLIKKFKPFYLEWVVKKSGIASGREAMIISIMITGGNNEEVYLKMLELERAQPTPSYQEIRTWYKKLTECWNDARPWIEWCDFEASDGDKTRLPELYLAAIAKMHPDRRIDFMNHWSRSSILAVAAPTVEFLLMEIGMEELGFSPMPTTRQR